MQKSYSNAHFYYAKTKLYLIPLRSTQDYVHRVLWELTELSLSVLVNTSGKEFALVVRNYIFQRSRESWYAKLYRNNSENSQGLKCQQVEVYQ